MRLATARPVTEPEVSIVGDNAVVVVNIELTGKFGDMDLDDTFRYMRVWKKTNDKWSVIGASCHVVEY